MESLTAETAFVQDSRVRDWPVRFRVLVRRGWVRQGAAVLTVEAGSLRCVIQPFDSYLRWLDDNEVHAPQIVEVVTARGLSPGLNVSIAFPTADGDVLVLLPLWRRTKLLTALREAGFIVREYRTWLRRTPKRTAQ